MTPTELEHRLTSALAARADQITADDLRPAAPPSGPRRSPGHHGWVLGTLTLAAAVLSIAVFVVLGQVRDAPVRPSHQPPARTSPTAVAPPGPAAPVASPSSAPTDAPNPVMPSRTAGEDRPAPEEAQPNPTKWASGSAPSVVTASPSTQPIPTTAPADPEPATTAPTP